MPAAVLLIVQLLEASPQIVSSVASAYNNLKSAFAASDQKTLDAAITVAYAKLETDVARVEAES